MYSATFAITIICGIAVINVFLGFALAMLFGHGPKSWADLESSIVLQPVPLFGDRANSQNTSPDGGEPDGECNGAAEQGDGSATGDPLDGASTGEANAADYNTASPDNAANSEPAAASAPPSAAAAASKKLVLAPREPADPLENLSPEEALKSQLEQWRESDSHEDDAPSLAGLKVCLADGRLQPELQTVLEQEIHNRIKSQLRRDRRTLQTAPRHVCWFSPDVNPEDALMPLERIRQQLQATRFRHDGQDIDLQVVAAVVHGSGEDEATQIIERFHAALEQAEQGAQGPVLVDMGEGPKQIAPLSIEVLESVCELQAPE